MSGGSGRRSVPTPCLSSQPAQARCRCDPFLFAAGQKIDQHAAYQGKNAGSVSLSDRSRDVSLCIDQQIQPVSADSAAKPDHGPGSRLRESKNASYVSRTIACCSGAESQIHKRLANASNSPSPRTVDLSADVTCAMCSFRARANSSRSRILFAAEQIEKDPRAAADRRGQGAQRQSIQPVIENVAVTGVEQFRAPRRRLQHRCVRFR